MAKLLYANTQNRNVFYAVRMTVPDPFFLIESAGTTYAFLDSREYGILKEKNQNDALEVVLLDPLIQKATELPVASTTENMLALYLIQEYLPEGEVIEVPKDFPLSIADFLREQGVELQIAHPFFPERLIKTADEVNAVRDALVRTQVAFAYIEEMLAAATIVGNEIHYEGNVVTTEYVRFEVEKRLLEKNMMNVDGIILSCGAQAAIPHHEGEGPWRPHSTIICDIFPRHRSTGYCADMTRTYVKGQPSEEVRNMYAVVQEAQEAAIAAVKPGVTGAEVHAVCVEVFRKHGYESGVPERGFCHGTGHGLGLDVHEPPSVSGSAHAPLEAGHVVTIEPGLYYPEHGGVRIEDVVVVTEDGCTNLTDYPKEYIIE